MEVPDEVADAIVEESRAEDANDAKQHYHCYSLTHPPAWKPFPGAGRFPGGYSDGEGNRTGTGGRPRPNDGTAPRGPCHPDAPAGKLPSCPVLGGKPFKEIAEAEGFTTSAAIVTVRNAIIKLQKYYIKRGWMEPPKEKAICTKTTPPKRNRKKTSAKKS